MKRGIKHHHMPGDIPKRDKIMLLEKKRNSPSDLRNARKGVKSWKKIILMKERAVLKERFQRETNAATDE